MAKKIEKCKNLFFASCPTGLETLLEDEIKQIKASEVSTTKGGVHFLADPKDALEFMLLSRIASRLFKKVYKFEIKIEKDLYFFAKEIKWKSLFDLEQTFKITTQQSKNSKGQWSKFKSSMFLSQNLKDGIVDKFRFDTKGERPSVDKENPDIHLLLHIEPNINPHSVKEDVTILIDMCGSPLSNRGYRDTNFSAPLKENLAAALVKLSGYNAQEHFVDPMCGSATILIESLLIKGNIPPSFIAVHEILENKDETYWDFQKHNWFKKDKYLKEHWSALLNAYHKKSEQGFEALEKSEYKTLGFDHEQYAINASNFNLKAAELADFVSIEKMDATKLKLPEIEKGVIVTNPPYGVRVGEEDNLDELYHQFGENLKHNFKNFRAYIFTGNLPMIKKISLRSTKKHILFNGNIESRLVEYQLY